MRILLATGVNRGHVMPFLGLAAELADHGHEVACYTERYAFTMARRAGATAIEAAPIGDFEIRARTHAALVAGAAAVARRTVPHLLGVLDRRAFDLLVVDHMHLGAALAAERSGLPWATLSTSPVLLSPAFRAWPTAIPTAALRKALRLPETDADSLQQAISPHLLLLPWLPPFDLQPPPPQAVHVGPLGQRPLAGSAARPRLPGGDGPLVLVSLSTSPHRLLRTALRRFLRLAAACFLEMGVRAIMTVGDLDLPARPRGSGLRVVRYLDHATVMPELDLVITHGGWGTIGNALLASLPLLIVPFERDQFANAELCTRLGLGLAADPRGVSAEALRACVDALLARGNPYAARARQIGRALRRPSPAQRAARSVLALARRRR